MGYKQNWGMGWGGEGKSHLEFILPFIFGNCLTSSFRDAFLRNNLMFVIVLIAAVFCKPPRVRRSRCFSLHLKKESHTRRESGGKRAQVQGSLRPGEEKGPPASLQRGSLSGALLAQSPRN